MVSDNAWKKTLTSFWSSTEAAFIHRKNFLGTVNFPRTACAVDFFSNFTRKYFCSDVGITKLKSFELSSTGKNLAFGKFFPENFPFPFRFVPIELFRRVNAA